MGVTLTDITKLATGVSWKGYLVGAVVIGLGAFGTWIYVKGETHEASKIQPVVTQGLVKGASGDIATRLMDNTTQRASHEAAIDTRTSGHVTAVTSAADDRASFSAYLAGLHDEPLPSPAPVNVGGVQGGPVPSDAPR